ncbi:MAG: hypothetical protein LRS48_01720 [Desulfurococcales archaeon]|nr:hypothetical protein [Desulfurococcales archaeon]
MSGVSECGSAVIKLGGSVITDKTKKYTINTHNLDRIVGTIKEYVTRGGRLALVHGGGSYGHFEVKAIEDAKGVLEPVDAPRVQLSMLRLAVQVLDKLVSNGIPAVLHPPHTLCHDGRVENCKLGVIVKDYDMHLVPVTYGDAIPVEDGVKIVSGDDLAAALASILSTDCLVYVIDKPGIIGEKGDVIPVVTSIGNLKIVQETGDVDVTGGITHKLTVALDLARTYRGNVIITNIDGLQRLLNTGTIEGVGSLVKPEDNEET